MFWFACLIVSALIAVAFASACIGYFMAKREPELYLIWQVDNDDPEMWTLYHITTRGFAAAQATADQLMVTNGMTYVISEVDLRDGDACRHTMEHPWYTAGIADHEAAVV